MDAAALIRQARSRAGLTQAALARTAGTSQPTLAAYESGARSPSVRTLNKIVRAAGGRLVVGLEVAPPARGALLDMARAHQSEIRQLALGRGIRNVRIFGSAARGEETAASDLDLLVDFDATRRGLLPLVGFAADVEALLGVAVDVSTLELLRDQIRPIVAGEAVPL